MKPIKLFEEFFTEKTNNSHLIPVEANRYVYHTSNPMFRDAIAKQGLIPKGKSDAWLSDTKINGKVIFAVNSDDKNNWWQSGYDDDIYRIDTTNLKNLWYVDPNFNITNSRIITFEPIPAKNLKLIYEGTGDVD